jgi:hypothetical protein
MGFKRALDREWEPVPGVRLRTYVMELPNSSGVLDLEEGREL